MVLLHPGLMAPFFVVRKLAVGPSGNDWQIRVGLLAMSGLERGTEAGSLEEGV